MDTETNTAALIEAPPDWYERRDELMCGDTFRDDSGQIVQLDRTVPGDGTDWYVLEWDNDWFSYDRRIHPGDLDARVPDPSALTGAAR